MKRTKFLTALLLVFIFTALLGTLSVFATENIKIVAEVSTDTIGSAAKDDTIYVNVKVSNPADVAAYKLAGIEIALAYDSAKLQVVAGSCAINPALMAKTFSAENLTYTSDTNSAIKFICIANDLTNGFDSVNGIFTVRFIAKEAISNLNTVFETSDVVTLLGDVNAAEITAKNVSVEFKKHETGSIGAILSTVTGVVFNDASTLTYGSETLTEAAVTGIPAKTKPADLLTSAGYGDNKIKFFKPDGVTELTGAEYLGTGTIIVLYGSDGVTEIQRATVIIKGDLTGDGIMTALDSLIALKIAVGNANSLTNKIASNYDGTGTTNALDALLILKAAVS